MDDITNKVKEILEITGDFEASVLHDKLYKKWVSLHPDRYTDVDEKRNAEEEFKNVKNYLNELASFIKLSSVDDSNHSLVKIDTNKQLAIVRTENIGLLNNNESLQKEIDEGKKKINELNFNLEEKDNFISEIKEELSNKEKEELIKQYEYSKTNIVSYGISILSVSVLAILNNVDKIANIFLKYSPVPKDILNYIITAIFIFTIFNICKKNYEKKIIQDTISKIKTPKYIKNFFDSQYVTDRYSLNEFSESGVYAFIESNIVSKNIFKIILFTKILKINKYATLIILKDIFINNLFKKKLINIAKAKELDRYFTVINTKGYY
jgi:hypothetical protein